MSSSPLLPTINNKDHLIRCHHQPTRIPIILAGNFCREETFHLPPPFIFHHSSSNPIHGLNMCGKKVMPLVLQPAEYVRIQFLFALHGSC
jgi:hypothetical protein